MKPVIMRMVVDLPAPLGPRKPSTSPRSTVNEMPSTARLAPKAFTRFSILIMQNLPAPLQGGALSPNSTGELESRSRRFRKAPRHGETHFDCRPCDRGSGRVCPAVSDQAGAHRG